MSVAARAFGGEVFMSNRENDRNRSTTSRLVDSVDQMVRVPLEMTNATWDLIMQGMQSVTGQRSSWSRSGGTSRRSEEDSNADDERESTSSAMPRDDQDLGGDDLKYVIWSIVFTKRNFECVLEPQHEEIINYSTTGESFAGLKIAELLERARHGHIKKPDLWRDNYPPVSIPPTRRTEAGGIEPSSSSNKADAASDRGWRIPIEDHKYITFLYRVERRLPKRKIDKTRVERVTIERGPGSVI
jgi:hypothetical protein